MKASINTALPKCVCASEEVKLIGSLDGMFPDFGHHQEREMGGLWLHPIKLLDGFWLRFEDCAASNVSTWIIADGFENAPEGNRFLYRSGLGHTPIEIDRIQMAPEKTKGLMLRYVFRNRSQDSRPVHIDFLARVDLRPVWFSDSAGIHDGIRDDGKWADDLQMYLAKDCDHEWHTAIASDHTPAKVSCGELPGPQGDGKDQSSVMFTFDLHLPSGRSELRFFISGSYESRGNCIEACKALRGGTNFEAQKTERYTSLLAQSKLTGLSPHFCEVFSWVKVNTDWLIQDSGPYGRGLTAGLPEYPWWFGCDSCYALQGVLALGDFRLCRDTLDLLLRYSKQHNGNGRILHEVTTGGVCVNPGNTQETAHFLVIVMDYFQYTGDTTFLESAFDYLLLSVHWLEAQDHDGDLFPSGYGIVEIAGLHSEMIDTAVYTCAAYRCFADICRVLSKNGLSASWEEKAQRLQTAINTHFWDDEEGLFCDAFTSYPEVMENRAHILGRLSQDRETQANGYLDALLRKKEPLGERESGWLINHNWVINTPMEAGIAQADKARRALARLHSDQFINHLGMYLNTLESHAVMTISTGTMAVAQARYGYSDRALELVECIFATFSKATPGCIYEMSPDYGCFVQAWTVYAVMVPIIRYFFGIQPDAINGRLRIAPQMPSGWHQAELLDVPILGGKISIRWCREEGRQILCADCSGALPLFILLKAEAQWTLNGNEYGPCATDTWVELPRLQKEQKHAGMASL